MQIIQPKRSKYKKSTINYNQDNLLDIIDIEETLSKNRFIEKVPKSDFIYSKFLSSYNPSLIKSPSKKQRKSLILNQLSKEKISTVRERKSFCFNINTHKHFLNNINLLTSGNIKNPEYNAENIDFESLNNNKFDIKFDKLKIEYKNGYKVLFINEYFPMKIIGSGAFGLVVNAVQIKTGKKMAVKIINKNNINHQMRIEHLINEVNILNNLNHPRIMKVYDILDNHKYFFIFMELIEGGNLKDLIIKRYLNNKKYLFRDSECALIMKGIFEALVYLHKKNIIHRDIKPENILFKNKDDLSSVIICDFGLAYHLSNYETSTSGSCGTVIYMAPEVLMKRNYDVLIDSFSAGIVLFILCSGGMHPFYSGSQTRKEYVNKLITQKCLCKFSIQMPLLARNLFLKLCKFEPMFRYEPFKALNHPWITRSTKSQIPMTLLEEYNKSEKIKNFKNLLTIPLALIALKKYLNKDTETHNKSSKVIFRTSSKTISNTHKLLNLKDKYLLLSNIKKNSNLLFDDNIINNEEIEKGKDNKEKERRTGRNKLASINFNHNLKVMKNNVKIMEHPNSCNKNYFIKTGLSYHNKNPNNINNNMNQNYIDIKSTLRTHSSKENINLKENNKIYKLRKSQKKSTGHLWINNIKISKEREKDKERSNTNIHRNKLYLTEKKNNDNNVHSNIFNNNKNNNLIYNNKLMIEKHIIIESKNKNKNFPSDIKNNNSLSSNRINYNSNNDNINNLVAILDRNKYNFNSRINLQLKPKENNIINGNILTNSKFRGKNTILKEVFNNDDF